MSIPLVLMGLSERERWLIRLSLWLLCLVVSSSILVLPHFRKKQVLERNVIKLQDQLADAQSGQEIVAVLEKEKGDLTAERDRLKGEVTAKQQQREVGTMELVEFFSYWTRGAESSGVRILSAKTEGGGGQVLGLGIDLAGTYSSLASLFQRLDEIGKVPRVDSVQLSSKDYPEVQATLKVALHIK